MDTLNLPTKKNLLLAKQKLVLAQKGYDLLDKKRHVLVNELSAVQKQVVQAWDNLCDALHKAYAVLHVSHAEMGAEQMKKVSNSIPKDTAVKIHFRSIMGALVPQVDVQEVKDNKGTVVYVLCETTASLDETVLAWNNVRELIVTHAAIENTIYMLKQHIKKTQKRANALGNITIPMYETRINYIQERMEERERDELARLKIVKKRS